MIIPPILPRLKGFCFPREIITCAIWACYRFALSTADVEDLWAARGVIVSRRYSILVDAPEDGMDYKLSQEARLSCRLAFCPLQVLC